MKFDSNRAWIEAMATVRANRDLLLTVGAFFFFLPTLVSLVLTADLQLALVESMKSTDALMAFMKAHGAMLTVASVLEMVFDGFGMLVLLLLLSDRVRPTVGQALVRALQGLPGLIGLTGILMMIFMAALIVISATFGSLMIAILGETAGGLTTFIVVLAVGVIYPSARLSMAVPALVLEGLFNPLRASIWSWRATKGSGIALAMFFCLLMAGFVMISFVATLLVGPLLMMVAGQGMAFYMAAGVLSGVLAIVKWVVLTAVLYRVYRQFTKAA